MKTMKWLLAATWILPAISFAMTNDGLVQSGRNLAVGSIAAPTRATSDGSVGNQETHARYMQPVKDGNVYTCADLGGTAVATQAGLSATTPALVLWNPIGSPVNLVINTVSVGVTVQNTTVTFMLAGSTGTQTAPTATTVGTVVNNKLGVVSVGNAGCYRISTLGGAPTYLRSIGTMTGGMTAGAAGSISSQGSFIDHVDGEIIVGPGQLVTVQANAVASILTAISYEEVTP